MNLNFNLIYILIIASFLFLSWLFYTKSQYDERRKKRFGIKVLKRRTNMLKEKLYNEEYENFLRRSGLPRWLTSEGINFIRISIPIVLLFLLLLDFVLNKDYLSYSDLMVWGSVPIILTPKKPFPLYYLVIMFRQKYLNDVSNEVYQLYNEIKSNVQINKEKGSSNTYYILQEVIPYYQKIKATLERMLPMLERKEIEEAWHMFSTELDTREAKLLGIVMKEVESLDSEQALTLLEQKRLEFSNHLYNRYTEMLRRRKTLIFSIVILGAMTVFLNEVTVFFMWYKKVMSVVNQIG